MRRSVHRIRAAHGCEHLRYASDPSNKECALRRLPRPRAVGGVRRDAGQSRKADAPPDATPVSPLSPHSRRPRRRSATSAIRRIRPSAAQASAVSADGRPRKTL